MLWLCILAGCMLLFSVSGLFAGRPSRAIVGVPLAAFFAWMAWGLSAHGLSRYRPGRLAALQDRFFATRSMRRLVPPPKGPRPG